MSDFFQQYDRIVKIVMDRKRLFLAVAMLVMAIGVVTAYALPKKYEAQSTVFIEQNVITDLVKGIAVTPSVDSKLKTLTISLLSRAMLMKTLAALDKDLTLQNDRDMEDYLSDLTKRITITYQERQGVFRISMRDRDPVFARDFVNTITRKYIDENTSSKRVESLEATKFLGDQIETFRRRIDAADAAINKFKSEKGFMLAADEGFLRGEIINSEKRLEDLAIKRKELEAKKRILTERGPEPGRLAEAEARLSELRGRYTDENPKVSAARAEVARLRNGGDGSAKGSARVKEGVDLIQVELEAYQEMEAKQQRSIEDNKAMLREIPNVRASLAELMRKKEDEGVIYTQLVSRYGQSEVSKQMELQDKSVTFRILDPAVLPVNPVSPNRMLIIVGSIVAGFGVALGVIWLLDMIAGGIKSPNALKELDIPVFAVIPHVPDRETETRKRRKDRFFVGFAACYILVILTVAVWDSLQVQENAIRVKVAISQTISRAVR